LTVAAAVVNAVLAFYGQNDIKVYFVANTIAFLAITIVYVELNPRARQALNIVGGVFFGAFMVIVGLIVVEIIRGQR
jgi:hypothetical protein